MVLAMKVPGPIIMPVEKESFTILMETSMMDCGTTTRPMDLVYTPTSEEHATKDYGKMISSMVRELKTGQKEPNTKVSIICQKRKEQANIHTLMAHSTKDNGSITKSMDSEATYGQMVVSTLVSGLKMICMVTGSTSMQTM